MKNLEEHSKVKIKKVEWLCLNVLN
jgi:hypothetical protein